MLFTVILGLYDRYYKRRLEKKYIRKVICQGIKLILDPRKTGRNIISREEVPVPPDAACFGHYQEMHMRAHRFLERRAFLLDPEDENELRGVFYIFETYWCVG